jgi:hypothetical protein
MRAIPKVALGVSCWSHLVLSLWTGIGGGGDHPHFESGLFDAWRRTPGRGLRKVVADAGYDAERNHALARQDMGIRSIIPATMGRRYLDGSPPRGCWRRRMRRLLKTKRSRQRCGYTQRWQVEAVNSMMKRNLGSACRGKTNKSRQGDLRLKVLTHNLMILTRQRRVETGQARPLWRSTPLAFPARPGPNQNNRPGVADTASNRHPTQDARRRRCRRVKCYIIYPRDFPARCSVPARRRVMLPRCL